MWFFGYDAKWTSFFGSVVLVMTHDAVVLPKFVLVASEMVVLVVVTHCGILGII